MKKEPLDPNAGYFGLLVQDSKALLSSAWAKSRERQQRFNAALKEEGLIARDFAERVRGMVFFVFGTSVMGAAVIASTSGVLELQAIAHNLISSPVGRIALFLIGASYFVAGTWRILTGRS
ncbi:MAG TPA: DUF1206 domain-containing protein [archaeon]|nr:DUF1206 domain-containing protein [archaeon]HLD80891.1 DUF1206 domain-containing protein [archaeon]